VIEASTDGGVTWTDVSALGVDPGYSGTLVEGGANPLAGRPAYSGVADGFPTVTPVVLDFGTQLPANRCSSGSGSGRPQHRVLRLVDR